MSAKSSCPMGYHFLVLEFQDSGRIFFPKRLLPLADLDFAARSQAVNFGQQVCGPTVNVILRNLRAQSAHAAMEHGGFLREGLVQGARTFFDIVRVNDKGVGAEIARGAGETRKD